MPNEYGVYILTNVDNRWRDLDTVEIPPEEVVTLAEQMAGGETPSLLGSMTA